MSFQRRRCASGVDTVSAAPTSASRQEAHDYDGLPTMNTASASPARPAPQAALNAAWLDVLAQAFEILGPGLRTLAKAGAEPPEVGLELADSKGRVLGDCELAWAEKRVVVLRSDQSDFVQLWKERDWTVVSLDDEMSRVAGAPWTRVVAGALDIELTAVEGAL